MPSSARGPLSGMRLGVVGLGLIGSSLAGACRERGVFERVVGFDVDHTARSVSVERGFVDEVTSSLEELPSRAEVLALAVPLGRMEEVASALACALGRSGLRPLAVFGLGSTARRPGDGLRALFGPIYAGLHPMAGKESSGVLQASSSLLVGKSFVLIEHGSADPGVVEVAEAMVKSLEGRLVRMSPQEHDSVVGLISHLPMLLACGLSVLAGGVSRAEEVVSSGFEGATRLASQPVWLTSDVVGFNVDALEAWLNELMGVCRSVLLADVEGRRELVSMAKSARERILGLAPKGG